MLQNFEKLLPNRARSRSLETINTQNRNGVLSKGKCIDPILPDSVLHWILSSLETSKAEKETALQESESISETECDIPLTTLFRSKSCLQASIEQSDTEISTSVAVAEKYTEKLFGPADILVPDYTKKFTMQLCMNGFLLSDLRFSQIFDIAKNVDSITGRLQYVLETTRNVLSTLNSEISTKMQVSTNQIQLWKCLLSACILNMCNKDLFQQRLVKIRLESQESWLKTSYKTCTSIGKMLKKFISKQQEKIERFKQNIFPLSLLRTLQISQHEMIKGLEAFNNSLSHIKGDGAVADANGIVMSGLQFVELTHPGAITLKTLRFGESNARLYSFCTFEEQLKIFEVFLGNFQQLALIATQHCQLVYAAITNCKYSHPFLSTINKYPIALDLLIDNLLACSRPSCGKQYAFQALYLNQILAIQFNMNKIISMFLRIVQQLSEMKKLIKYLRKNCSKITKGKSLKELVDFLNEAQSISFGLMTSTPIHEMGLFEPQEIS